MIKLSKPRLYKKVCRALGFMPDFYCEVTICVTLKNGEIHAVWACPPDLQSNDPVLKKSGIPIFVGEHPDHFDNTAKIILTSALKALTDSGKIPGFELEGDDGKMVFYGKRPKE